LGVVGGTATAVFDAGISNLLGLHLIKHQRIWINYPAKANNFFFIANSNLLFTRNH
jgi:hypothetical protein